MTDLNTRLAVDSTEAQWWTQTNFLTSADIKKLVEDNMVHEGKWHLHAEIVFADEIAHRSFFHRDTGEDARLTTKEVCLLPTRYHDQMRGRAVSRCEGCSTISANMIQPDGLPGLETDSDSMDTWHLKLGDSCKVLCEPGSSSVYSDEAAPCIVMHLQSDRGGQPNEERSSWTTPKITLIPCGRSKHHQLGGDPLSYIFTVPCNLFADESTINALTKWRMKL